MVEIRPHNNFVKKAKKLSKKFNKINHDILTLISDLKINPRMGISLGNNSFKIRVKNSNKTQGKSGGYRVITYLISNNKIFLLDIYDKGEQENSNDELLDSIIKEINEDIF
jgi:mRNA-degrading endonuclease RelE of RelBE toxin-antitoxin system